MNISKEVRIGLLVTAAAVIFFTGFSFLKGSDIFSNDNEYFCYYKTVDGLQKASMIQINGLNVGQVADMELAGVQGVKVTLSVHKSVKVTKGTIAALASSDLLGTKVIRLDLADATELEAPGAELKADKDGGVVDKLSGELTPRLEEMKGTIIALNNALANINSLVDKENQRAISDAIQSIKVTSDNLAQLSSVLSKESEQISGIIRNTHSVTANMAKSNDTIRRILSNVNTVTAQLADAPIQKTIADLQKTTAELQGIMDKINNSEGTLGLLVNDKEAYHNLNKSLESITRLTDDLKARPGRYINVSVFGGKKRD